MSESLQNQLKSPLGPSLEWILRQNINMQSIYSTRNSEYSDLREIFNGDYAGVQDNNAKPSVLQDRIKVVYNITNATVRRYMDSLSQPPRIEATPRGFDKEDVILADKRTKWLEQIWEENNMPTLIIMAGFYQSLLDKAIFHVRPDPSKKCGISIQLAIPDSFLPMPIGDNWEDCPIILYSYKKFEDSMKDLSLDPMKSEPTLVFSDVIECWSKEWFVKIENGKETIRIKHNWGFISWFTTHNIPIPHRYRGQGDCDQAVGLNSYLNLMFSDMADIINYAANPIAVVRGSKAGATSLPFAPRAVWELERDAQAGFLQWTGTPPAVETQILRTIQAIEDMTGVSSPAFGREIPSGVSGNAVRSLMAGFNTRVGTKQQLLGECLAKINTACQAIAEKELPNKEYEIVGEITSENGMARTAHFVVKPKEFGGWYKNQIIFEPTDPTARFFQEMEKMRAGIQSKYTTMRNLGMKNISDEFERIRREAREQQESENSFALASQGNLPALPTKREPIDFSKLDEGYVMPKSIEGKQRLAELMGANSPNGISSPGGMVGSPNRVDINDIQKRLQSLQLSGKAELASEPDQTGAIAGPIAINLESQADESQVRKALSGLPLKINYRDFSRPPRPETTPLPRGSLQRNRAITKTVDAYLRVMVLDTEQTNTGGIVARIGIKDMDDAWVELGKTNPQRRIPLKQGDLIAVHIATLSRREVGSGVMYSLGQPQVVRMPSAAAKLTSIESLNKIFDEGKPATIQEVY